MLLEKDRIAQASKVAESQKAYLEECVKKGKSAERLLNNPDWKRLEGEIRIRLLSKEAMIAGSQEELRREWRHTPDQDHVALNALRQVQQEVDDFKFIFDMPKREAEAGLEAEEELAKIRSEEGSHG